MLPTASILRWNGVRGLTPSDIKFIYFCRSSPSLTQHGSKQLHSILSSITVTVSDTKSSPDVLVADLNWPSNAHSAFTGNICFSESNIKDMCAITPTHQRSISADGLNVPLPTLECSGINTPPNRPSVCPVKEFNLEEA